MHVPEITETMNYTWLVEVTKSIDAVLRPVVGSANIMLPETLFKKC